MLRYEEGGRKGWWEGERKLRSRGSSMDCGLLCHGRVVGRVGDVA